MASGYDLRVWRVNVGTQTLTREPVPEPWLSLGGRGLVARILLDETDPSCEPLGPRSKLVWGPGLLVGHMLSASDRLSVGGKSPLTGGFRESNCGGSTGMRLTTMGVKALIVEGVPAEPGYWVLHLSLDGARWFKADDLAGRGVHEVAATLLERHGKKVAIAMIGTGGEQRLATAGIQNLDKERVPARINARGGLGAVMGSKGLKAIVFDDAGGQKPPIVDPEAFKRAQRAYTQSVLAHPQSHTYRDYGTAANVLMCDALGALPTRNFSSGSWERAEAVSGEHMRELLLARKGDSDTSHACMAGCTIRCSNIFAGEDGRAIVSPLEYETIGLLGPNLEIASLDDIARLNWEINDMGLDTIEVGAAIGVACEAGLMTWGDVGRAMELLGEIRKGTPLGRILGAGSVIAGKVFGVERVPASKGMAMSAYDPRAIKGTGVTFATSTQGGDHTSGLTLRAKIDHLDPKGQVEVSRAAQINIAGYDSLGVCIMAGFGYGSAPGVVRDLLNSRYGWSLGDDALQVIGKETIRLEREYNRLAGFTKAHDRLPEWFTRESLPPKNTVFDVPPEEMDTIFADLD
ncbi:MAG: aldehyde ferredoxin oxidoreductase C-terminal domain-containing protein [Acidobacteriota bacterium]